MTDHALLILLFFHEIKFAKLQHGNTELKTMRENQTMSDHCMQCAHEQDDKLLLHVLCKNESGLNMCFLTFLMHIKNE